MKILNSNNRNFDKASDNLLLQRKRKVQSNSVSVSSIIKDVKKNGDTERGQIIISKSSNTPMSMKDLPKINDVVKKIFKRFEKNTCY